MDKVPMTPAGHAALTAELADLKSVRRPAVIAAIATAREHGDLSENAEYHAAKEQQSFIEGRIKELEGALGAAQVVDPADHAGETVVRFGARVTLVDEETEEVAEYQIVGPYEADADKGRLSIAAPIARALIGKRQGDSVTVRSPKGARSYAIEKVWYA
ncbi:MAG TPA: transcription elongation factor GreA [Rhodospirillaceae bacterium]|jgi:transcription elongation factor GreA|nr:transcription elongation factor GreA [Alphaproteobacteria bacterium]HBH26602.1 transcription elongation factor GreA [Rhodospirillaceae bacterium]